jgi:drug/metabolite transporter (DMT)-like permease
LVGIGDMLANVLFLLAVRQGMMTLVAVVTSLYPAVTVLLAVAVLREPILRWQGVGLAMTAAAVTLIAAG